MHFNPKSPNLTCWWLPEQAMAKELKNKKKRFFLQKTYKWRGLTWRREESGIGREGRRSGEIKWGNPLRVERRRAGVSIWGQLPSWNTPVLAAELPLLVLHAFTENFMLSSSLSFASLPPASPFDNRASSVFKAFAERTSSFVQNRNRNSHKTFLVPELS